MPTIETKVWKALRTRLEALVLNPVAPIAWPNENFSAPIGTYLRATHLPNVNSRLFLKGSDPHQMQGIFQIDVFTKLGQNTAIAIELAGLIVAHFPAGSRMSFEDVSLEVTRKPDAAPVPPSSGDTHAQMVVSVYYRIFK